MNIVKQLLNQLEDAQKVQKINKVFYLNFRGVEATKIIGAWLWMQSWKSTPPNQLEIFLQAIGHMQEKLKNPNVDWERLMENFYPYKVSKSAPKIACGMSEETFGELMAVEGMILAGFREMIEATGKSISTSEVVNFCLQERAREISSDESSPLWGTARWFPPRENP